MTKINKSNINQQDVLSALSRQAGSSPELMTLLNRTLCMKDFVEFVRQAWDIVEPGTPYSHNWHIDFLAEELMAMYIDDIGYLFPDADIASIKSKTSNKVTINIPTRSMKTLLVSVFFPTWIILHKPSIKVMTISYSEDLSRQINRQRRDILNSAWYQKHFGDIVKIKEGMDRQDMFETEQLGIMFSTSVRGTVTGYGGDLIILDDIQKPIDMYSDTERNRAVLFLKETLPTRLNNRNTGKIINVQQRLHFNDLTGYVIENMPRHYNLIKIPLIEVEDRVYEYKISNKERFRPKGEVLWESRLNLEQAQILREELGSMAFEAQQQQDPTPEGGNILNTEWFKYYKFSPQDLMTHIRYSDPEKYSRLAIFMSWDMTFKVAKDTDYVACVVGLYDYGKEEIYIVDYVKERLTFTETLSRVMAVRQKWERYELPITVIVEDKANGSAVLDVLSQRVAGFVPFDPGNQDKVTRMKLVVPFVESGKVHLPDLDKGTGWAGSMVAELAKFPFLEHDDIPDAFSQLLVRTFVRNKPKKKYNIF